MAPAEPTLSALVRRLRERATGRPHAHSSQTNPPDAIYRPKRSRVRLGKERAIQSPFVNVQR
jgi:hypothetical protein